jgi:hypothetical protein
VENERELINEQRKKMQEAKKRLKNLSEEE